MWGLCRGSFFWHINVQLVHHHCWEEYSFCTELPLPLSRSIGHVCLILFLDFLFCSIDLCVGPFVRTTSLSWWSQRGNSKWNGSEIMGDIIDQWRDLGFYFEWKCWGKERAASVRRRGEEVHGGAETLVGVNEEGLQVLFTPLQVPLWGRKQGQQLRRKNTGGTGRWRGARWRAGRLGEWVPKIWSREGVAVTEGPSRGGIPGVEAMSAHTAHAGN